MKHIIKDLSKELSKNNIFHKIDNDFIKTRRSVVKIPKPSIDIAYLLGVIRGDGSLSKSKRKRGGYHYTFRIYSGDENYLRYLSNLFENLFLIKGIIIKDTRKESSYHLVFKNAILFFYFVSLGSQIGKKKHGKIPKIVIDDKKNQLNYIAGLVDTDGSISTSKKRVQLKQKSLMLLKKISKICKGFHLNCSIPKVNYTNNIPFYYIRFNNNLPLRLKTNKFLKD